MKFATQSRVDFRAFVRHELARELPREKSEAQARALHHLGFLPSRANLAQLLEDTHVSQVAAYYDPRQDEFRILSTGSTANDPPVGGDADGVMVHELTHALQHHHFDLVAYQEGPLDDDARSARTFVVEGEAMFVMLAAQFGAAAGDGHRLGPWAVAGLRMSVAALSGMKLSDLMTLMKAGFENGATSAEGRAEVEALRDLPPLLALGLMDPYLKGAAFVSEVWGAGGWDAVARLYRQPPSSTEQVLHPREKFLAYDAPVRIELAGPVLPGARPLFDETVGEHAWRAYFATWKHPAPEAAAAGWGGDRLFVWGRGGKEVGLLLTTWDDEAAAIRFEEAFATTLPRRWRGATLVADSATGGRRTRRPDGSTLIVLRRGSHVDVVDGANAAEVPILLEAGRLAKRTKGGPP